MSSSKLAYRTYNNARVRVILSIAYTLKAINSSSFLVGDIFMLIKTNSLSKLLKVRKSSYQHFYQRQIVARLVVNSKKAIIATLRRCQLVKFFYSLSPTTILIICFIVGIVSIISITFQRGDSLRLGSARILFMLGAVSLLSCFFSLRSSSTSRTK